MSKAHPKKHVISSNLITSGTSLSKAIETDSPSKKPTTLSPSPSTSIDPQAVDLTVDIREEENQHLKEQLKSNNSVHEELITSVKESSKSVEDKRHREAIDSTMDTLFKVVGDQAVEPERLTRDPKALKEQLETQAANNGSLAKENIEPRNQVRRLKSPPFSAQPPSSSLPRIPKYVSSTVSQSSEKAAKSHHGETSTSLTKDAVSPQRSQFPSTSNTSLKAKFKEKVGKLFGHWAVGKHDPSKSSQSYGEKKPEGHQRSPTSATPSTRAKEPPMAEPSQSPLLLQPPLVRKTFLR